MIKNVVFDYGNVMVHFDPEYITGKYVTDEADEKLICEVLFDRSYWDKLDEGLMTDEEMLKKVESRLPKRLWDVSREIYYNWIYNLPQIEGMNSLVEHIKNELGARVFLLSNISAYFASHAHERDELKLFEKCVFSAVIGKLKPNKDIFMYLCSECDILPGETLFVDDAERNISGAEACGMKGYLFDGDSARLRKYIDSLF